MRVTWLGVFLLPLLYAALGALTLASMKGLLMLRAHLVAVLPQPTGAGGIRGLSTC